MISLSDLSAPAKLNLFLHVIGRRADGYHLLQSVFVLIDWADTLHVELRTDGKLQRHDLGPALPQDDLCLRAARSLQAASGTSLGADISIDKLVPWGAGLGGGSSDAATVLLALNRLWKLNWPRARLLELGAQIGADVPFFIGGRNAFVEGVGEQLTPIDLPTTRYVVVKPPTSIATQSIFSSPLLERDSEPVILAGFLAGTQEAVKTGSWQYGRNDLQPAAQALCPEVGEAARWLETRFGNSRMSGSGSAVFAQVPQHPSVAIEHAPARNGTEASLGKALKTALETTLPTKLETGLETELAADSARSLPASWVVRPCRSLAEHPLVGWAS